MDGLKNAVSQVLDERGVLDQLRAQIRAEIYETLEQGRQMGVPNIHSPNDSTNQKIDETKTPLSPQQKQQQKEQRKLLKQKVRQHNSEKLINELIIEYLEFQGLQHSLSVFLSESNINSKLFHQQKQKQNSEMNQNINHPNSKNKIKSPRKCLHNRNNIGENKMPRDILSKRLGIIENDHSRKLPLIYSLLPITPSTNTMGRIKTSLVRPDKIDQLK